MKGTEFKWVIAPDQTTAHHSSLPIAANLRKHCLSASSAGIGEALQLICDECSPRLTEVFARESELVARYEGIPAADSFTEIRWSVSSGPTSWAVDTVVSMQTNRMDLSVNCTCRTQWWRQPTWVCTEARGWLELTSTIWESGSDSVVRGYAVQVGAQETYCEFIWPADYDGLYIGRTMEYTVGAWRLAEPHLEKGVIRRMRLRGVYAPIAYDSAALDRFYDEFLRSPVPLTA